MKIRKVVFFCVTMASSAIILAACKLFLLEFAIFSIFFSISFSRFMGGLDKEVVDYFYYILGSIGIVLIAFANPFNLQEIWDRQAVRDFSQRVELISSLANYPIRPISMSDQTDYIIEKLEIYFSNTDFSSLVNIKECNISSDDWCDQRNIDSLKAFTTTSFREFISKRPININLQRVDRIFDEYSKISIYGNLHFSHVFDFELPAKEVFILLATMDENSPSFTLISDLARSKLSEEKISLAYYTKNVSEETDYGIPNVWKQVSNLFWPYVLLIALGSKLARSNSYSHIVITKHKIAELLMVVTRSRNPKI